MVKLIYLYRNLITYSALYFFPWCPRTTKGEEVVEAVFVTGLSSCEYWLRQRELHLCPSRSLVDVLQDPLTGPGDCARIQTLGTTVPSSDRMRELCEGPLRAFARPIHVLVAGAALRRMSRGVVSHVWSGRLPSGAFVRVADHVYVSSPPFCLVQLAGSLSVVDVARLASEWCAVGLPTSWEASGIGRCQPLVTLPDLIRFTAKLRDVRGVARVRKALHYVVAGAASPMESAVALLLSLPRAYGGYGFERPVMNHRIALNHLGKKGDDGDYCLCDLFWPGANVGIEYDSDLCHTGRERIYRDALRRNRLGAAGVEVITVTRGQLKDMDAFDVVARQLAQHLGRSMKAHDEQVDRWRPRAWMLRSEILGAEGCMSAQLLKGRR